MMNVSKVSYRKKFNLGNYETEDLEVEVTVQPGENPGEAMARAKQFVEKSHHAKAN